MLSDTGSLNQLKLVAHSMGWIVIKYKLQDLSWPP